MKINLGCGTNKLPGWKNYDKDINIRAELPFDNDSADFILAEHVVEHIGYYEALLFFRECFRVLKPEGVLRVAVPSIERIWRYGTEDYFRFVSKWMPTPDTPDVRGALYAILFEHGHKAPWTESLLTTSLFLVGFNEIKVTSPGRSRHPELQDVEGHGKVIGEEFNWIETVVVEATKIGEIP